MKKLFALALAVIMVLSLVCVAGAADFADAGKIDIMNKEAVTVLSEMGIIAGFEDGSFKPDDTLTRAQAAKIICYMLLGKDAAEALTAADGKFADVPASHWSNKYVTYCADKGIVAGTGANKFNPNGKLTGYAFGKMLLCGAAGFDAAKEGLTGADWDVNTRKLLKDNGLLVGTEVASGELNRQNACHLALNFLFLGEQDPMATLAYKVFGVTRMGGATDPADLNRPLVVYSTEKADVCWKGTDLTVKASPIFVETGKLICGEVVEALGGAEPTSANCNCYRNGVIGNPETFDRRPLVAGSVEQVMCSGDAITTEFYRDAGVDVYTCIQYFHYPAKITAVTEADVSSSGRVLAPGSVSLNVGGTPMKCDSNEFTKADVGSYALITFQGGKSWTLATSAVTAERAKTVTGVLETEDNTLRVSGKLYPMLDVKSNIQANCPTPFTPETYIAAGGKVGDNVILIMDLNGVVHGIEPA